MLARQGGKGLDFASDIIVRLFILMQIFAALLEFVDTSNENEKMKVFTCIDPVESLC